MPGCTQEGVENHSNNWPVLVWCANAWWLSVSAPQPVHKKLSGNCSIADYWCEADLCGVQVVSRSSGCPYAQLTSQRFELGGVSFFIFFKASWRINSFNGVPIVMTRSYLHCGIGTKGHMGSAEWVSLPSVSGMKKHLPEGILVSKGVSLVRTAFAAFIYNLLFGSSIIPGCSWVSPRSNTPLWGFNLFSVPTELSRRHFKACSKIPFRACLEISVWKTLPSLSSV